MDHKARFDALAKRLCDVMDPAIVINTLEGETIEANDAYRQMTGYSIEELRRLKYQDITPGKWHESEARLFEQVAARGYSDVYEKAYQRKDGTLVRVENQAWLIDLDADPPKLLGILRVLE